MVADARSAGWGMAEDGYPRVVPVSEAEDSRPRPKVVSPPSLKAPFGSWDVKVWLWGRDWFLFSFSLFLRYCLFQPFSSYIHSFSFS